MAQATHSIDATRWRFNWEKRPFFLKINREWHKPGLQIFTAIVLAHWAEHLVQAFQVYALGWPLKEARGLLGIPFPWLVKSELMHYLYAVVMLAGIWVFRQGFTGRSYKWWMIAFGIQFWHHFEHLLLQGQVIWGENFFGAPAPISIIQFVGFLGGPASEGFGGVLTAPGSSEVTLLMLFTRRVEVHLIYNSLVFIPMLIGMVYHLFPNQEERSQMVCSCAGHFDTGNGHDARQVAA